MHVHVLHAELNCVMKMNDRCVACAAVNVSLHMSLFCHNDGQIQHMYTIARRSDGISLTY